MLSGEPTPLPVFFQPLPVGSGTTFLLTSGVCSLTSGAMAADQRSLLARCWSCRFLGGTALLVAAAWIYRRPRALIRSGLTPGMGDVAQITFAICVGAWGVVILVDPVGKQIYSGTAPQHRPGGDTESRAGGTAAP